MSEKQYEDSYRSGQYRLLSPWAYVGYGLLFSIPLVGWILAIVFSLNDDNLNRRNFARAYWCGVLVAVILVVVILIISVPMGGAVMNTFSRYAGY